MWPAKFHLRSLARIIASYTSALVPNVSNLKLATITRLQISLTKQESSELLLGLCLLQGNFLVLEISTIRLSIFLIIQKRFR